MLSLTSFQWNIQAAVKSLNGEMQHAVRGVLTMYLLKFIIMDQCALCLP